MGAGAHRGSLHFATPDFLSNLVALGSFMRLSYGKPHTRMSSAAWQEIRVRFGSTASRDRRDDKVEGGASMGKWLVAERIVR